MYHNQVKGKHVEVNFDMGTVSVRETERQHKEIEFEIEVVDRDMYSSHLNGEWMAYHRLYLTENEKIVIITIGLGYLYFISVSERKIIKHIRLFPEVTYDSVPEIYQFYENTNLCAYFEDETRIDFSPAGKYIAARVGAVFDPQGSQGEERIFTPVYYKTVFLIERESLEVVYRYQYSTNKEMEYEHISVLDFSPDDRWMAVGAPGAPIKVIDITKKGDMIQEFDTVQWIPDSGGIRNRKLAMFLDEDNLLYIHNEKGVDDVHYSVCIMRVSRGQGGKWHRNGKLKINTFLTDNSLRGIRTDEDWEYIRDILAYDSACGELLCLCDGKFGVGKIQKRFKLDFTEGSKFYIGRKMELKR